MDSWLWDPPDEANFSLGEDWQPDFCFWHEPDTIENDAANAQACIQALKILIKNADREISELEEDIVLLQCQLALTDETLSESWSNALREKIKFLEMSLERLKNEDVQKQDQQEVDDQLQLAHGKPAEKIHEILKRLLENQYTPHKDEQNKGSDDHNNGTSMDKTKLIYSVAEDASANTSREAASPSRLNARNGEDCQQTIAVLKNASGSISSQGSDSNIGICCQSDSEEICAGVEMPSFTKSECATLKSLPKSTDPILAKHHKLADMIIDSLQDAAEQEQLLKQNFVSQTQPQPAQKLCLAAEIKGKPHPMTNRHASENRKSPRQTHLDIARNKSLFAASGPSLTLGSQSQKKWRNSSIPTVMVIDEYKESRNIQTTSEGQKDTAQCVISKDHQIKSRHKENIDVVDRSLKSSSSESTSMDCEREKILESFPKDTLRSLAKNKNLKGYYKLRKAELIKLLMERVNEGDLQEVYPSLFV